MNGLNDMNGGEIWWNFWRVCWIWIKWWRWSKWCGMEKIVGIGWGHGRNGNLFVISSALNRHTWDVVKSMNDMGIGFFL